MVLPKIDVPTFDLELPGTNLSYNFRPFLVKEEKLLTLAAASESLEEMVKACKQVIKNCCMQEIDVNKMPMYLVQWIFLHLRSKSVGEKYTFILSCGNCKDKMTYECDVEDFKLQNLDLKANNKIFLNDVSGICLKYPSVDIEAKIQDMTDIEILKECIDSIYTEEENIQVSDITDDELTEFVDNMTLEMKDKIVQFFASKPYISNIVEYECKKCNNPNVININGYEHFFV